MWSEGCRECQADNGYCVYCALQFQSPYRLHLHIAQKHEGTIRHMNCDDE